MDEDTLTWNEAVANAPNAVASRSTFDAAGNEIGIFSAPGTANTSIVVPISGSDIQTFGGGLGSAIFGATSNSTSTMNLTSKEANAGVNQARIFTFDVVESNGTGGGAINTAATWSDNAVPMAGNLYRVLSGDALTADGAGGSFSGEGIIVNTGASAAFTANATDQKFVQVQAGATLTQNSAGDFFLGDISNLGSYILDGTATFNPSAGADIGLDMVMTGAGAVTVNSNGAGSNLFLSAAGNFLGTVSFAGTGDEVLYSEPNAGIGGRLEMNSTGLNQLVFNGDGAGGGTTAFNQPGSIDHRSTVDRLNGMSVLEANAPVTADVTKTYDGNERRLFVSDSIEGSAAITVNGTATNPTGGSVSFNEFEVENTDEGSAGGLFLAGYSGTLTANNFVNVELRRVFLDAKIQINQDAVLDVGFRDVGQTGFRHRMGDIEIASGGTLNVGYEEDDQEHSTVELIMSNDGSKGGDLTMASGSKLQIQISGSGPLDFDRIVVEGTADLAAEIVVLTNPELPAQGYITGDPEANPWVPTLGDTFDIIVASSGLAADFDGQNGVDAADLAIFQASYGVDAGGDADFDGDTDGSDFLIWQQEFGTTGSPGSIIDNGITFSVDDSYLPTLTVPGSTFGGTGLMFQLNVSSTLVQLEVVAAVPIAAVPEPTSGLLVGCGLLLLAARRRRIA
jgi:hypothetical protein